MSMHTDTTTESKQNQNHHGVSEISRKCSKLICLSFLCRDQGCCLRTLRFLPITSQGSAPPASPAPLIKADSIVRKTVHVLKCHKFMFQEEERNWEWTGVLCVVLIFTVHFLQIYLVIFLLSKVFKARHKVFCTCWGTVNNLTLSLSLPSSG